MEIHISCRRWTNKICWRRSGTENIHLDTGSPNSTRRSERFSWRIRRVSKSTTSRLTSGCRWSDKWVLVHVRKLQKPPSRWTQSQTSLADRRIIPCSTEIHWRLQNYTHELGCYARKPHRWLLENRWIKRFVWFLDRFHSVYSIRRKPPDGFMRSGVKLTKRQATSRPDHLWPELWTKLAKNAKLRERSMNVQLKNWNSKMPEDYEESISFTLRTRSSKKPLGMLDKNWKRRWLLLCLTRQARHASMGWPVARLMISSQNLRASWKPVNPQECLWKNLYRIIMRTILRERVTIHDNTTIWYTNLFLWDSRSKSSSG